jgi:hypothetical protein
MATYPNTAQVWTDKVAAEMVDDLHGIITSPADLIARADAETLDQCLDALVERIMALPLEAEYCHRDSDAGHSYSNVLSQYRKTALAAVEDIRDMFEHYKRKEK